MQGPWLSFCLCSLRGADPKKAVGRHLWSEQVSGHQYWVHSLSLNSKQAGGALSLSSSPTSCPLLPPSSLPHPVLIPCPLLHPSFLTQCPHTSLQGLLCPRSPGAGQALHTCSVVFRLPLSVPADWRHLSDTPASLLLLVAGGFLLGVGEPSAAYRPWPEALHDRSEPAGSGLPTLGQSPVCLAWEPSSCG